MVAWGRTKSRVGENTIKRTQDNFGGDGYVHYFDHSDGFMSVYTGQNLGPNCIFEIYAVY